jgi:cellulose synthase/poly-beta-1,6-N-acetylglucosamine synthase-like glycosyltransferase
VEPDFLQKTVGHFYVQEEKGVEAPWVPKKKAAFIQTPQDFFNVSRSDGRHQMVTSWARLLVRQPCPNQAPAKLPMSSATAAAVCSAAHTRCVSLCAALQVDAADPMVHCARFFYGPMLQGRDGIGACPCCGTGVVFRRDVLVSIGGQAYGSITED